MLNVLMFVLSCVDVNFVLKPKVCTFDFKTKLSICFMLDLSRKCCKNVQSDLSTAINMIKVEMFVMLMWNLFRKLNMLNQYHKL